MKALKKKKEIKVSAPIPFLLEPFILHPESRPQLGISNFSSNSLALTGLI
jgi:hypothetical protein